MNVSQKNSAAFAYGTLQIPQVLAKVLGRVPSTEPGRLAGFRSATLRGVSYPGMIVDPAHQVYGTILGELTGEDWALLEAYEGVMYERQWVTVTRSRSGEPLGAQTFVLRAEFAHLLTKDAWSLEEFTDRDLEPFLAELEAPYI